MAFDLFSSWWAPLLFGLGGAAEGAAAGLGNPNIAPSSFADRDEEGGPGENFFLQDPVGLIQSATRGATNIGQGFSDLARQPVTLPSAFAQQPPSFVGGSLPVPIGVNAVDPALFNPALLGIPGVELGANPFQSDPVDDLGRGVRSQRGAGLINDAGAGIGAVPDLAQATGAAQLLAEAAKLDPRR